MRGREVAWRFVGTDIYGAIEYRNPNEDEDWFEGEPWVRAIDVNSLHDDFDYAIPDSGH